MLVFTRLGLWGSRTAFKSSFEFVDSIKKGECGAMELVAMHMKASGQYLCRVLSFDKASFEIIKEELEPDFVEQYNRAAEFWEDVIAEFRNVTFEAKNDGQKAPMKASLLWGAHQRFWMQMCMAAKVPLSFQIISCHVPTSTPRIAPAACKILMCAADLRHLPVTSPRLVAQIKHVVKIAKEAVANSKCCVIGLQNTGESVSDFVEKDLLGDDVPSTASGILVWFIEQHCTNFSAQDVLATPVPVNGRLRMTLCLLSQTCATEAAMFPGIFLAISPFFYSLVRAGYD